MERILTKPSGVELRKYRAQGGKVGTNFIVFTLLSLFVSAAVSVSGIQNFSAKSSGDTVITGSFMHRSDGHYFIAGYTPAQGSSFLEKRLLGSERPVWRFTLKNNVRISAISSNAQEGDIAIVGEARLRTSNKTAELTRMVLLTIKAGWGDPFLNTYFLGEPVLRFKPNKVVAENGFVFVCGQSSSLGTPGPLASTAVVFAYNNSMNLQWSSRKKGRRSHDGCVDIASSRGVSIVLSTVSPKTSTGIRSHVVIDSVNSKNGAIIWSENVTVSQISAMILAESQTDRKLLQGEVLAEKLLFLDGFVILVGTVTSKMQFENYCFVAKISRLTGSLIWVRKMIPSLQNPISYLGNSLVTSAIDSYIYVMSRYSYPGLQMYTSIISRVSMFNDFALDDDVSGPLWTSDDSEMPYIGLEYNDILGAVLAVGQTGGGNTTFVELGLGPADNTAPMPLCWACEGIDFLLVCFNLVSTNLSVKVRDTRDFISDMFRIPLYQIWVEQESSMRTKAQEEERICCRVNADDTATLREDTENRIRHFIIDLAADGRSILERRLGAPQGSLFVKDSEVVVSKQGKIIGQIFAMPKMTVKDIADDVMRLITLSAVSLALVATASVLLVTMCRSCLDEEFGHLGVL